MKRRLAAAALLGVLAGCKSERSPTAMPEKTIVQKVEDAGISANDLAHADAAGLQVWFLKHRDVARNVASQCKAAGKDDLAWKTSNEGRICLGDKFANYGDTTSK
jgi:hypothetical protein